jgi:hypothetical protein
MMTMMTIVVILTNCILSIERSMGTHISTVLIKITEIKSPHRYSWSLAPLHEILTPHEEGSAGEKFGFQRNGF